VLKRARKNTNSYLAMEYLWGYSTDPDFQDILSRFIFGEVFYQGNLDD
jgi:hypothetical protein